MTDSIWCKAYARAYEEEGSATHESNMGAQTQAVSNFARLEPQMVTRFTFCTFEVWLLVFVVVAVVVLCNLPIRYTTSQLRTKPKVSAFSTRPHKFRQLLSMES